MSMGTPPPPPPGLAGYVTVESLVAYAERLADFIIDHIGEPYTAEECGHVLEIRSDHA